MSTSTKSNIPNFTPHSLSFRWNVAAKEALGDVIGLTTADMDFPRSPGMEQVITDFAKNGCLIYPKQNPNLVPVTLNRIHEHYGATNINKEDIVFFPSVVTSMNALIWALNHERKPYTLVTPNYPPLFHLSQPSKVVEVPLLDITHPNLTQRAQVDYPLLEKKMREHDSKVLLFSNPNNPLGKVWSHEEMAELYTFTREQGISLISDEIWADWTFDQPITTIGKFIETPESAKNMPQEAVEVDVGSMKQTISQTDEVVIPVSEQVVEPTVASVMASSKTFNLGGMNCAYVLTKDPLLRKKLLEYLKFYCIFPPQIAQEMMIYLYTHGDETFNEYKRIVSENRKILVDFMETRIPQIKVLLGSAIHVVLLDASGLGIPNPSAFFLEHARVHLFHGTAFGSGYHNFMRINIGTYPEILTEALKRMEQAVKTHKPKSSQNLENVGFSAPVGGDCCSKTLASEDE